MTRINCNIPPRRLSDQHLLAEHREIKRIPNVAPTFKGTIPPTFRLGTGHVSFFIDKGGYTLQRYREIYRECCDRGFTVTDYASAWDNLSPLLMKDYEATPSDSNLIIDRILSNTSASKQIPRYRGMFLLFEEYRNLLINGEFISQ